MKVSPIPQLTLADYEERFADRHMAHHIVRKWAQEKPSAPAIINADRGTMLDWASFERQTAALADSLCKLGLHKGDFFATSLPLLTEHVVLEFACFRIGVIAAPLDLRLSPAEVIRSINLLGAKAFAFLGKSALADFCELGRAVRKNCPTVEHFVQFSADEKCIEGAQSFASVCGDGQQESGTGQSPLPTQTSTQTSSAKVNLHENDGALVIFTTGSTGSPKPALLSHRNITCQCMCISQAFFGGDSGARTLVNLPASHVGCQTELMMGTLFGGGTAVILETFDPARSLRAIEQFKVNIIGQIPAMFNFEWRLRDYEKYDLSSLDFAAYGGQQVSRTFLDKMAKMAPVVATGLGLTESAGFCTYIQEDAANPKDIFNSLGVAMPVYPFSIRQPMRDNGSAGDELADGQIGDVCFRGPQTFLGYVNDPEATARAISSDGWLYTGDLGLREASGLRLTGRAKWVIKSFGYQVFPGDIENHVCALEEKVASCAVVGVEHATISEGIVAFVEKKADAEITTQELDRHARALASYMRPRHWVLLEPGQMPLTRSAKADYMRLSEMAREEVRRLREQGQWDAGQKADSSRRQG
jgi:fatty-acyl-CoA synthase